MPAYKLTRMELLRTKKRIKLAEKGHKLLKQKRDVLIIEFFLILKDIKKVRINLSDKLGKAQNSLYNAIAIEGTLDIERLSLGLAQDVNVNFDSDRIMGVEIPKLTNLDISYQWPGYFDQSVELDNAIVKYRKLFPDLIKLAEKQLILKKLAEEIKKTKRRVNALEYLIIPRLNGIKKNITFRLEELERENFSRLKVMKKQHA
ncbi:MAG: V-type ATP synthase subunit D [Nanoarchaeota archaeon]|nr:V-type ATP synthase subunit D [Nanoarchaeota archaeon]